MKINVCIKKLDPNAVVPKYAKPGDAGMDLTAVWTKEEFGRLFVKFGIAMEIPKGYVGLIFPRSSVHKTDYRLTNCVGVIDSGYRGEISAVFDVSPLPTNVPESTPYHYKVGDRCAQILIMPYPEIEFVTVDKLSTTERGEGGYGSTGK